LKTSIVNSEEPLLPISTAAKLLNVSVHTLRMYEREGLFIAFKKNSNHRLFSKSDIERIECIRRSINEFKISINSIKAIYSLIPCWDIFKCSSDDRKICKAFNNNYEPCWGYCKDQSCRNCTVYKKYYDCGSIKKLLASFLSQD
jgi:MerR family transcriptional regulator, heat shock protein HspR